MALGLFFVGHFPGCYNFQHPKKFSKKIDPMQHYASRRADFGGGFGIVVARRGGFKINVQLPCFGTGIQLYSKALKAPL